MPAPSPNQLRARAAALQSHEDLLRDQLQFFTENDAVECPPDADAHFLEEQYLAAASRATHVDTESSALLPAIEERPVPPRSRSRRRNVKTAHASSSKPFPLSFRVDDSHPSVFARREKEQETAPPVANPSSMPTPSSGSPGEKSIEETSLQKHFESTSSRCTPMQHASSMLASMSQYQIHEAQREIFATLNPESISFLRQRSSPTVRPLSQPNRAKPPPSETAHPPAKAQRPRFSSSHTQLGQDATEKKQKEHEQLEQAKRFWMTDATEKVPTQEHVDAILQKAVQDMGPIAKERFDLTGNLLTAEQIDALPTHKGLHHHGTSPASAGYTLADLLVLTRSTFLSQRVMALKVLTTLIDNHGERIIEPMLASDCIGLVFAPLPAADTFHSALTSQVAYLEAVECLLQHFCVLDQNMLIRDSYFASDFYSPAFAREDDSPLLSILSEQHIITTLIEIAKARCTTLSSVDYSKRALNSVRMIVSNSQNASQNFVHETDPSKPSRILSILMQLAVGTDRLNPSTTLLACDIVASVFAKAAWLAKGTDHGAKKISFSEDFLLETAAHLNWALRDIPFELTPMKQEASKGVLRLFRAYLSQNYGVHIISAFLPAICRLVHETDDNLAIESFLVLEAYVHCLALKLVQESGEEHDESASEKDATAKEPTGPLLAIFTKDQLVGLTPQVVAAAKIVVATRNHQAQAPSRRAAAGHFVATALTVIPIPFDDSYYRHLKCVASEANRRIVHPGSSTVVCVKEAQAYASLSHATARILNGKPLETEFVRQEVEQLINAAHWEKSVLPKKSRGEGGWRLIANACAEWVGLLSRLECTVRTLEKAAASLSCVSDVQVILDLTSRCILRKEILLILGGDIGASEAEAIARKFIPQTWSGLNDSKEFLCQFPEETRNGDPTKDAVLVSLDGLVGLWLKQAGGSVEGIQLCNSLFRSQLLNNSLLFERLVEVPLSQCAAPLAFFDFLLQVGKECIETDGRLIKSVSKTKRSTLSTTTDSQFSTSVLSLTDHLVSRGPVSLISSEGIDSLGSIVLSIMCGVEADSTLRQNMWNRCVEECGGAALFELAEFLNPSDLEGMSSRTCLEKDDMIARYISAAGNGFLDPNRCPDVVRRIVLSRLSEYCASPESTTTLENLFQSLTPPTRRTTLNKIFQFAAVGDRHSYESLANWVRSLL
ncbi:unnamed protein product [Agarophyton chilense]